jgi:lipopolysaccharide export system permease protein
MFIQMILISTIVPKSQEVARTLLRTSGVDYFEGLIKPQKFNDSVKGLTIYAERKNINGVLENIYIKKKSLNNKFQITFAKEGIFETRNDNKILVLYDGQTLNNNNNKITNFKFSKSDFGIADMSTHTVTQTKIQEVSTYELIYCVKSKITKDKSRNLMNCTEANLRNVYKELYKRLIIPFYIPSLILISLLLIIKSKENIEYFKFRILIFILGVLLIILSESTLGYITDFHLTNIKFVALPFLISLVVYFFYFYKLKFKIRKLIL